MGDVDGDSGVGVDGVKLDLLDVLGGRWVGSAVFADFDTAGQDAAVGRVDVVEEDFLSLVAFGGDALRVFQYSVR